MSEARYFLNPENGGIYGPGVPPTKWQRAYFSEEVVVIFRASLPDVQENPDGRPWAFDGEYPRYLTDADTPERLRKRAAMYLALAEYREKHPPVDEEQVKALQGEVARAVSHPGSRSYEDIARTLVERGVRVEAKS